jgi:hypothetical protein
VTPTQTWQQVPPPQPYSYYPPRQPISSLPASTSTSYSPYLGTPGVALSTTPLQRQPSPFNVLPNFPLTSTERIANAKERLDRLISVGYFGNKEQEAQSIAKECSGLLPLFNDDEEKSALMVLLHAAVIGNQWTQAVVVYEMLTGDHAKAVCGSAAEKALESGLDRLERAEENNFLAPERREYRSLKVRVLLAKARTFSSSTDTSGRPGKTDAAASSVSSASTYNGRPAPTIHDLDTQRSYHQQDYDRKHEAWKRGDTARDRAQAWYTT